MAGPVERGTHRKAALARARGGPDPGALPPLPNPGWTLAVDRAAGRAEARSAAGGLLVAITLAVRDGRDGREHQVSLESPALEAAPAAPDLARLLPWSEAFARAELGGRLSAGDRAILRFDTGAAASAPLLELLAAHGFELAVAEEEMVLDLAPRRGPGRPASRDWRPWSAETAGAFFAVYAAAFRDRPGFPDWDEATWRGRMTGSPDFRPDLSVLLHHMDEPAAYALVWLEGAEGWIVQMGVRPESRGRGLGRRLLAIATSGLAAAGAARGHLSVNVDNPGAAALYASFGFRPGQRLESYRKRLV